MSSGKRAAGIEDKWVQPGSFKHVRLSRWQLLFVGQWRVGVRARARGEWSISIRTARSSIYSPGFWRGPVALLIRH